MLKVFRNKNVSKAVLWALLILILPAFVLWGTGSGRGGAKDSGPKFVGVIDGKKVTFNDFAESLGAIRCQVMLNYFNQPQVMDALLNSKPFLGKLAWDRLLMAREARKERITVSNAEVVNFVRSHPLFTRGGSFDDRIYYYALKNNMGLDPRAFEEIARESLKIQKLTDRLTKDVKLSDEEVVEAYGKANNKLKISYLSFSADTFTDKAVVEEAQIREYYEAHKSEMVLPPKEGDKGDSPGVTAKFDDVKSDIKNFLAQKQAGEMAIKAAGEEQGKLKDLMEKENLNFDAAAAKLGQKIVKSEFFSGSESLEGIGGAEQVIEAASKLKPGEASGVIETKKGAVIFTVTDSQKFDEEKFKKEKDDYSKKAAGSKKAQHLEGWLRNLEKANKINIDFQDYDKYYR